MPAKSQAQRALLNARFGHEWVKAHGFDNKGKLPAHVSKGTEMKSKKKPKPKKAPAKRPKPKGKKSSISKYY